MPKVNCGCLAQRCQQARSQRGAGWAMPPHQTFWPPTQHGPTKRFDALFCSIDLVNLVLFGNVIDISKKNSQFDRCQCYIYSVSQKSSPLKLFAIFSLRLSIFPWNFASMLPVYIYTYVTTFSRFIFITNEMALIFLREPIVFSVFSFKFHPVKST